MKVKRSCKLILDWLILLCSKHSQIVCFYFRSIGKLILKVLVFETVWYLPSFKIFPLPWPLTSVLTSMSIPSETHMFDVSKLTTTYEEKPALFVLWIWVIIFVLSHLLVVSVYLLISQFQERIVWSGFGGHVCGGFPLLCELKWEDFPIVKSIIDLEGELVLCKRK